MHTVKELRAALEGISDDAIVCVDTEEYLYHWDGTVKVDLPDEEIREPGRVFLSSR